MPRLPSLSVCACALIVIGLLASPATARAQVELVSANPAPDSTVTSSPAEIRLVFNRVLLEQNTEIRVTNEAGKQVDLGDSRTDPADRFALVVGLPILFEGQYTVSYMASTLGSSTVTVGEYTFIINLPDPQLLMKSPANGQSFPGGEVPVRIDARFVDFALYNTRILLYVDGEFYIEMRQLRASITGLSPGTHEIRIVLMQLEDFEVPQTASTVTIAVPRPIPPVEPPEYAPPDPSAIQIIAILVGITALLIIGVWLGQRRA